MAQIAPTGGQANLMNLMKMFKGTSSSQTTSSNMSKEGMDALLQQILGSSQGLAAIAGGQKASGMYNSTVNQMLMNDFVTRAAGELEKQRAGTTVTTRNPAQFGIGDIGGLLLAQGASQLLGPTVKGLGSKIGLDKAGIKLAETLGVKTAGAGAAKSAAGGLEAAMAADMWMPAAASSAAEAGLTLNAVSGTPMLSSAGADVISGMIGAGELFAGTPIIPEAGMAAADLFGAAAAGTGAAAGAGSALGGWAGMAEGAAVATELAATAGASAGGAGILSSIVGFLSTVGSFIASLFSDERLKTDIKQVGFTNEGQPIYTYKYKHDPVKTHMGVMAQETLEYHPEAVHRHPSGALMVDYDRILGLK